MRAIMFEDVGKMAFGTYDDPKIQEPDDVIVRISTAAICGSDLHVLHGRLPGMRSGAVMGHEGVGEIVEAGPEVKGFKPGDRVVVSMMNACHTCWFCRRGQFNNCDEMWVFGYGMFVGDLDGTQAEFTRVPRANGNLHSIDPALTDEQAIFAGDILTTGVYIADAAGIKKGDVVAITGAGPVGLFTLMAARSYEPDRVYMVDMAEDRLKLAERIGAIPVNASKVNPVVEIQRATGERGADVVLECVGAPSAFDTAIDAVRAGGTLGVIGVYTELEHTISLGEVWRRNIDIKMGGACNIHAVWNKALELVKQGKIDPTVIISHTLPLDEGLRGYDLFEKREALKVVLKP